MSDGTGIEWTDATWNVVIGCDKVSAGCDHCYAIRTAHRMQGNPNPKVREPYAGTEAGGEWTGRVNLVADRLTLPLQWKRPRRIFVNAQSDLFHDSVPDTFIGSVFDVMARAEHHTFQILTKRHARMRALLRKWEQEAAECVARGELHPDYGHAAWRRHDMAWVTPHRWPLPNVWLGVSTEDQRWADIRIPALLDTPAAIRFVSAEPLLGPIDLTRHLVCADCTAFHSWCECRPAAASDPTLDWVIVGGESGPGSRPMHPDWARGLRDQCQAAEVAFLFKQWGDWVEDVTEFPADPEIGIDEPYRVLNVPRDAKNRNRCALHSAGMTALNPDNTFNPFERGHGGWTAMRRPGKHAAGRVLDGRTWDEYPEKVAHA